MNLFFAIRMNRNELNGLAIVGVGFVYFGIKKICSWIIEKSFIETPNSEYHHIIGKTSQDIGIYSYKDNPQEWNNLDKPVICDTFDLIPAYFRISNQIDDKLFVELPTQKVVCKLDPNVDVQLNICSLYKVTPSVDTNYNGVLNHPTQLGIILKPDTYVIVYGYQDKDDIFHIKRLSNYPVDRYKKIVAAQKAWKINLGLFGTAAFIGLTILFQSIKE